MRALLDTGAFLRFISDSDKLSANARKYIADLNNELLLSVVSLWQIAEESTIYGVNNEPFPKSWPVPEH